MKKFIVVLAERNIWGQSKSSMKNQHLHEKNKFLLQPLQTISSPKYYYHQLSTAC